MATIVITQLLRGRLNKPHHGSCPSVCPWQFVCLSVTCGLLTRKQKSVQRRKLVRTYSRAGVTDVPVFNSRGQRPRSQDVNNFSKHSRSVLESERLISVILRQFLCKRRRHYHTDARCQECDRKTLALALVSSRQFRHRNCNPALTSGSLEELGADRGLGIGLAPMVLDLSLKFRYCKWSHPTIHFTRNLL